MAGIDINSSDIKHITKLEKKATDRESMRAQQKKTSDDFIKMMITKFKHRDPLGSEDPNQITETLTMITQTNAMLSVESSIAEMLRIQEEFSLNSAKDLLGAEVSFDEGTKELNSQTSSYDYEIKLNKDEDLADSKIIANINIKNEKGVVIFSDQALANPGLNKFIWNGKDKDGRSAKLQQKYTIDIEASYEKIDDSGKIINQPVYASTNISGKVSSVEMFQGKPKLKINGKLIDMQKVTKISDNKEVDLSKYISYVGKEATLSGDKKIVVNGIKLEDSVVKIISSHGLFNVKDIIQIEDNKSEIFLMNQANDYIGKEVMIDNYDIICFDEKADNAISFKLTDPGQQNVYQELQLEIFDMDHNSVAKIVKDVSEINYISQSNIPKIDELRPEDQEIIRSQVQDDQIDAHIKDEYLAGRLFKADYYSKDAKEQERIKLANQGINVILFSSLNQGENKLITGSNYRYNIEVKKLNIATRESETIQLKNENSLRVENAIWENGDVKLTLSNGIVVLPKDLSSVKMSSR